MADKTLKVTIDAKDNASATFSKVADSAKTMGDALEKAGSSGVKSFAAQVRSLESEMGTLGKVMAGIGGAMTAAIAAPMAAGAKAAWNQVDAVQKATIALRAYEKDASKVDTVLRGLLEFARSDEGRLFQRQELFAAAQGLKVAGAETSRLTDYVKIMSRAVNTGMASWGDLNRVIGRVLTTGRLTTIEFEELQKAGFRLDDSLRNTTVSADQLFAALDKGAPAVSGFTDTIAGQTTMLQTAIRGLGLAFLQVDSETSEFIAGGLGAQLYDSLGMAREALNAMVPAAEAFGQAAAIVFRAGTDLASAFLGLPQPIQTAAVMMTGLSGAALTAGGAFLILLPKIVATVDAIKTLGGIRSLALMAGRFTAIGAAATVATVAIAGMYQHTQDMVNASKDLDRVWRDLQLSNLGMQADELKNIRGEINNIIGDIESGNISWLPFATGDTVPSEIKEGISRNLADAVTDSRIDYIEFFTWIESEIDRIGDDAQGKRDLLKQLADPNTLINFRKEVEETTEATKDAAEANERLADALARIDEQYASTDDVMARLEDRLAKAAEETDKWNAELVQSAQKVAGLDDALSQWNLTGIASDAAILANNITDVGTAVDTAFRSIVGNTNAIKSQADSLKSWADDLIAVRGEYSRLDELVTRGFITGQSGVFDVDSQYAKAQDAYDSIAVSTASIHDNIDAIQAIQAPLISDLLEKQATYLGQLRTQDEQVQLVALGWMDATTAGRAFEFQQLAIQAASSSASQSTKDAFAAYIEGAANADPVLAALLEEMGLIRDAGTEGFKFNTDGIEGAKSEISMLNDSIDVLITTLGGVPPLRLETNEAQEAANAIIDALGDIDTTAAKEHTLTIRPIVEAASGLLSGASNWLSGLLGGRDRGPSGTSTISTITIDAIDNASPVIGDVITFASSVDGYSSTVNIDAQDEASATIGDVISFAAQANGYTSTLDITATDNASAVIGDAVTFLSSVHGYTSVLNVIGDDQASAVIGDAVTFLASVDGYTSTLFIEGVDNASSVIGDAISFLSSVDGYSATVYLNTVNTTAYRTIQASRHGGIPTYAHGGVIAELAENGPEMLHFANGGTAPVFNRGIYGLPDHTYVSPSNTGSVSYGGTTFNITVNGGDVESIRRVFADEIVPKIQSAVHEQRRGMGV